MASINTIVKRKQYLWLGIVVVGTASAIGGALYLSDVDMSGNGETVAEQEPVPDMTGVVDTTFDDKVRQHATTEMQVTAAQMQKQYEEIRRELDVLNKQRGDDQRRIEKLGQDNAALAEQVKALGANPVTATGEPVPQMPASPPGPEGEPQPGNTPVSFPPQGSVAVPPPTAFYPGNGVTPPPQVTYQSVPVPNRIQRKVFTRAYYMKAAATQFPLPEGMNLPLTLRHYLNGKPRCRRVYCVNHNGCGKRSGRLPGKICCRSDCSRWSGIWFVTCRKRKPWAETDTGR